MKITKVTTTKNATAESEHAKYQLEFTISNEAILRVYVSIFELITDENGNDIYIGNISYENETVNCSIPVNSKAAVYFADFDSFLNEVKTSVAPPQAKK